MWFTNLLNWIIGMLNSCSLLLVLLEHFCVSVCVQDNTPNCWKSAQGLVCSYQTLYINSLKQSNVCTAVSNGPPCRRCSGLPAPSPPAEWWPGRADCLANKPRRGSGNQEPKCRCLHFAEEDFSLSSLCPSENSTRTRTHTQRRFMHLSVSFLLDGSWESQLLLNFC